MKDFWNDRYSDEEFAYGKAANEFFKSTINDLNITGNLLLPCEGEGRNAVYAAKQGFNVSAFDSSEAGFNKAMSLAKSEDVTIQYDVNTFENQEIKQETFDVIALIYAHFSSNIRQQYHQRLIDGLKPGGYFIIEGFSKDNLKLSQENPKIGGPQNIDLLYDIEILKNDFKSLEIISLTTNLVELNEGKYHIGKGSVVRMIAKKEIK